MFWEIKFNDVYLYSYLVKRSSVLETFSVARNSKDASYVLKQWDTNLSRGCRSVRWRRTFDCVATSVLASIEPASPRRRTSCAPSSHLTSFPADATTTNPYLKTHERILVSPLWKYKSIRPSAREVRFEWRINKSELRRISIPQKIPTSTKAEQSNFSSHSKTFFLLLDLANLARSEWPLLLARGEENSGEEKGRRERKREREGPNFPPLASRRTIQLRTVPSQYRSRWFRDERRGLTFSGFLETVATRAKNETESEAERGYVRLVFSLDHSDRYCYYVCVCTGCFKELVSNLRSMRCVIRKILMRTNLNRAKSNLRSLFW